MNTLKCLRVQTKTKEAKYIKGIILLCLWMTFFNPQLISAGNQSTPIEGARLSSEVFEKDMERLRSYRIVTMEVSAYTGHEGGTVGAWGKELAVGDCASDDLPQGTVVVMAGKTYVVNDRFGGGYIDKLDIYYVWDLDGALEFGRRTMEVKVLEERQ